MSETDLKELPMLPTIQFIDWSVPFLPSFVSYLMEQYQDNPDSLADTIIVVPTTESGRKLRFSLAEKGCVLAPKVVTPQFFLAQRDTGLELGSLYAWVDVLMDLDLDQARGLFPKDPPDGVVRTFRWAFNVGKQLHDLANNLVETNKDFSEIGRMSAGGLDGDRWSDLAMLAERVEQTMRSWKVTQAEHHHQVESNTEIFIAGVADLGLSVTNRLTELLHQGATIRVIIHGDVNQPHGFDDWGRPVPSVWLEEEIPFPNWKENVVICEKPSLLGEQIVAKIAENQWLPNDVTLGLCDRELAAPVTRELSQAGWDVYDPEGKLVKSSSFMQFLRALRNWLADERPLAALLDLLRLPQIDAFLSDSSPSRYTLIKNLELIISKRLVTSSLDLIEYLELPSQASHLKPTTVFLKQFLHDTDAVYSGSAIKGLRGWIARALNRTPDHTAAKIVDDLAEMFNVLEKIEKKTKKVDLEQALDLICQILAHQKTYADPSGTMIDLKGWVELMYEEADETILLGLHEGTVPASGGDDPFLPDSMREMLGLETSRDQYARDSYIFRSILESRSNVHVYLTKLSESNVPNAASRLLLRSTGKDLAERVQRFFGDSDIVPKNPSAWQRDWSLQLPKVSNPYADKENPNMLSPTALRDYLHCPLRFYLKRVLKMERFTPDKTEMDALDFGNLVHAVVEKFGLDETARDSVDESEINASFQSLLEKEVFIRFGSNLHLAVQIQVQIASNRLRALAKHQAEQRELGWKIIDVELKIGKDLPWNIAGHPMTMMLDRVERHEHTGQIRVMDYKSSSKAKAPREAHLENFKPEENKPILGDFIINRKKEQRWSNLQLPLYAWFAQEHYGCDEIPAVGYIQLPNAVSDTSFTEWEKFDQELLDSAKLWAQETVKHIQDSDFYSPANLSTKEQGWDDYAKLAQGDIAEAFGLSFGLSD